MAETKKAVKAKKPDFVRQDSHKRKSFKQAWRRPRGLQSKLRLRHRGKGKRISAGYRSGDAVRDLHPSGLAMVTVKNVSELASIDPAKQGIVVAGTLGDKKRIEILKEAENKKIKILNIAKPSEYVKNVEGKLAAKKKVKEDKAKKAKAAEKKKEDKKKTDDKKKDTKALADKVSDEEKKDAQKQEKDKVLTKPQK